MSVDLFQEGVRPIREGRRILNRDMEAAWQDQDFNMAVRRAQEAVELVLKGGLKTMGVEYPKEHDVGPLFCERALQKHGLVDREILDRGWQGRMREEFGENKLACFGVFRGRHAETWGEIQGAAGHGFPERSLERRHCGVRCSRQEGSRYPAVLGRPRGDEQARPETSELADPGGTFPRRTG